MSMVLDKNQVLSNIDGIHEYIVTDKITDISTYRTWK